MLGSTGTTSASNRSMEEVSSKTGPPTNTWKIVGALALLVVVLAVLFFGPSLGGGSAQEPEVNSPSMENIPPPGAKQLTIEVPPESEAQGSQEQRQ